MKTKNNLLFKNRYVLISFLASAGTMLVIYIITGLFPFGEKTILRMDLYHQYGPLFAELYEKMFSHNFSTYSWQSGLGSCFLGNYFNYLSSPIGAIVVFFGHKHVPEAIAAMILIKAALSSASFTYYLKKSQHNHSIIGVAFGMMYAFCAYMLAYYWNVMWLDAMVLLPIVLLGIERIIDNGKPWIYIGALSLSLFSNYYMSYMLCLFSVSYFIYYYIISNPRKAILSEEYKSTHKKKLKYKLRNSKFFRSGMIFAGASLLAAALMAFALIPTFQVLKTCSATSSNFPSNSKLYFNFFDFFANHLASLETTIRSSGDDVLPNVYCGILAVILAPLYFFTKTISKKEKVATLVLLAIFFISFNSNYLNYIWHGMHFPNDLPYRFSFMYSFILLVMAYKTFVRLNEFTSKQIGAVGAAILAFCFLLNKIESKNVKTSTIFISLILTVLYVVMLTVLKDKKYEKAFVATLLCVFVCCEIIVSDTNSIPTTITRESYESDYEDFELVKTHLDTIEQRDFYRMELTNLRTRMDPSWFGYNGVSIFSSMAYEKVANLENRLGLMSNDINSYTYNPQTPVFNMMHSLKYIVNNTTPNVISDKYYKELKAIDKYTIYENKYYLPIAFGVSGNIVNWDYQGEIGQREVDPFEVQGDFFNKATGAGNPFERLPIAYINYTNVDPFTENVANGSFKFNKTTTDTDADASASFSITTQKAGNVYIYFNVEGGNSKDVTINSKLGTITQNASHDAVLDLGTYEENETITVSIPFEQDSGMVRIYAYTINDTVLKKGYKKLNENTINITKFEDDVIEGKFTTKKKCVLFTSIPYDEGWAIYVDGERVNRKDYLAIGDAFIGLNLSKGTHEIRFEYHTKGLSAGIKISVAAVLLLALIILVSSLRKKRGKVSKKPAFAKPDTSYGEYIILPEALPQVEPEPIKTGSNIERVVIKPPKTPSTVVRRVIKPRPLPEQIFEVAEEEISNSEE